MESLEVGLIAVELYNVVVLVYWIDDANTKKTIEYRLNRVNKMFDGGFVSKFAANKTRGGMVVRLWCETKNISSGQNRIHRWL